MRNKLLLTRKVKLTSTTYSKDDIKTQEKR